MTRTAILEIGTLCAVAVLTATFVLPGCSGRYPASSAGGPNPPISSDPFLSEMRSAIETALREPPPQGYPPIPPGVRLLSVTRSDGRIVLDFSKQLLANGVGAELEDSVRQILNAASAERAGRAAARDFEILVEGKPLQAYRNQ